MNWHLAVEKNHEALKRVLAMLVSLMGMGASEGVSRPATLPRHLHRFVLSLLRPAESATRRLIIVAARGLVVKLPKPRPRKPKAKPEPSVIYVLDRVDGRMVSVPMVLPEPVRAAAPPRKPSPSLPLLDPMKRFDVRRRYAKPGAMPQIRILGDDAQLVPFFRRSDPIPPPPSLPTPDDPLDAGSIHRRLDALASALGDLPKQAQRMARWQARRDARLAVEREVNSPPSVLPDISPTRGEISSFDAAPNLPPCGGDVRPFDNAQDRGGQRPALRAENAAKPQRRFHRLSPMRPGRPPGWRRKPNHDVFEVLNELHGLAVWARERRDSS